MPAGEYSTAPFQPAFLFTLGDGWSNDLLDTTGGEVFTANSSLFWLANAKGGTNTGQPVAIGPAPGDVVKYLQMLKATTASAPTDVTIGGVPARQIDITALQRNNFVLISGHVGYGFHAGTKARFLVLEQSGATVTVIVSSDPADAFGAVIAATSPVLDSIVWQAAP